MTHKVNISDSDVVFYNKDGFLLPKQQLFSQENFNNLYNIFEELLANKGDKRGDELDVPHFRDKRLFNFLMDDGLLDIVEKFIGPNIGLWSSHFISKEPKIGRRTPWHEDSSYWKGRFDRMDKIITIWLALDNVDQENGCMGVIPGSHKNGFSEYTDVDTSENTFWAEINSDQFNEDEVVWFELNKGEFSLHDGRIIHGANANESDRRRAGFTMRYFDLGMNFVLDHPLNIEHKIWHCRGETNNNNPLLYL